MTFPVSGQYSPYPNRQQTLAHAGVGGQQMKSQLCIWEGQYKLTFSKSTWDFIGFIPGLLTCVFAVEFVVSLVDAQDLLGQNVSIRQICVLKCVSKENSVSIYRVGSGNLDRDFCTSTFLAVHVLPVDWAFLNELSNGKIGIRYVKTTQRACVTFGPSTDPFVESAKRLLDLTKILEA